MAQRLADWVSTNIEEVKVLTKRGILPLSLKTKFDIYVYYCGLNDKSKMKKYQDTATHFRLKSVTTVINALNDMQKQL